MYETKNVWDVQFKDILKFHNPKMHLTPPEKGQNILNFGQKKRNVFSLNLKNLCNKIYLECHFV